MLISKDVIDHGVSYLIAFAYSYFLGGILLGMSLRLQPQSVLGVAVIGACSAPWILESFSYHRRHHSFDGLGVFLWSPLTLVQAASIPAGALGAWMLPNHVWLDVAVLVVGLSPVAWSWRVYMIVRGEPLHVIAIGWLVLTITSVYFGPIIDTGGYGNALSRPFMYLVLWIAAHEVGYQLIDFDGATKIMEDKVSFP